MAAERSVGKKSKEEKRRGFWETLRICAERHATRSSGRAGCRVLLKSTWWGSFDEDHNRSLMPSVDSRLSLRLELAEIPLIKASSDSPRVAGVRTQQVNAVSPRTYAIEARFYLCGEKSYRKRGSRLRKEVETKFAAKRKLIASQLSEFRGRINYQNIREELIN